MANSIRKLEETIRKGFQEVEKGFEEFNIKIANKSLDMLKDAENLANNCDPKFASRMSDTNAYVQKHADDLPEQYNNFSSMISMLEKKFESECTCMKK